MTKNTYVNILVSGIIYALLFYPMMHFLQGFGQVSAGTDWLVYSYAIGIAVLLMALFRILHLKSLAFIGLVFTIVGVVCFLGLVLLMFDLRTLRNELPADFETHSDYLGSRMFFLWVFTFGCIGLMIFILTFYYQAWLTKMSSVSRKLAIFHYIVTPVGLFLLSAVSLRLIESIRIESQHPLFLSYLVYFIEFIIRLILLHFVLMIGHQAYRYVTKAS